MTRLLIAALLVVGLVGDAAAQPRSAASTKPEGEMRWALYVTLAPAWFDPGETTAGFLTPFWILYALHDALVKPMPGNLMAPSLAESWTVSADQRGALPATVAGDGSAQAGSPPAPDPAAPP